MKRLHKMVIWAALLAVCLLAVLSVVGAFLNTTRARGLFNSPPLAVFWLLLAALLVLGLMAFRRLVRSPGLLAVHLGSLLVLAGAMYGSDDGHALMGELTGVRTIPSGLMRIYEGHATDILRDRDGLEIGKLPYKVGLKDFWLEHYEDPGPWLLGIDAPPADDDHVRRREVIDWAEGKEVEVPFVGVRLKVVRYLPSARPVLAEDARPVLEITPADGKTTRLPAEVGQEVSVEAPKGSLRIVEVFSNLVVRGGKAVDLPGSPGPPALRIEFEPPEGEKKRLFAYGGSFRMHGHGMEGLDLRYVLPEPTGAQPDPDSGLPGMEVRLTYRGKEMHEWLFGRDRNRPVELSLAPLLGSDVRRDAHGHEQRGAYLMMAARQGPIRDYRSSLVVLEEQREAAEKVIEVNDPLHYGGYHFYQADYDKHLGQYTVLSVRSDAGLWPVYAGFVLLCGGTFWLFWVHPVGAHLLKRRSNGNQTDQ